MKYLETHQGVADVNQPFQAGDSDEVIADHMQALINECVADTKEHLDYGLLRMAVRYLEQADRTEHNVHKTEDAGTSRIFSAPEI